MYVTLVRNQRTLILLYSPSATIHDKKENVTLVKKVAQNLIRD